MAKAHRPHPHPPRCRYHQNIRAGHRAASRVQRHREVLHARPHTRGPRYYYIVRFLITLYIVNIVTPREKFKNQLHFSQLAISILLRPAKPFHKRLTYKVGDTTIVGQHMMGKDVLMVTIGINQYSIIVIAPV